MIVPYNRYTRKKRVYEEGGEWQSLGNAIGFAGNLGASIYDSLSPADQYGYDKHLTEKSALKGAASGAAAGTALLPGIGTVVGGLIGGVGGIISGSTQEEEALKARNEAIRLRGNTIRRMQNSKLSTYDTFGNADEGSLYAMGGQLKQLNSDTVEVDGQTHAEGGVQIDPNTEVEDKETISGDYVFSELLGFAKPHKAIAKQIGKIEKKPINNERRTSLEILRKKEAALKQQQEQVREDIGANLYDNINQQMGGKISSWAKYKGV